MQKILLLGQIVLSILFSVVVLIQARGTGFARSSSASFTRRGFERFVFRVTFLISGLFLLVSILSLIV